MQSVQTGSPDGGGVEFHVPTEVVLPPDYQAPRAAREVVVQHLQDAVAASVLESTKLIVTELVANSVRHSGTADGVTVRVQLADAWCRVEVADTGHDGVVAPRPADPLTGGGMGLNIVEALSERWGLERGRDSGTRVWAQLQRAPLVTDSHVGTNGTALRR